MELRDQTFGQPPEPFPSRRSPTPPEAAPAPLPQSRSFDPDALTRALRIAGAALVVASASTFMLQNWHGGDDLLRYAMLVGQSLLLAAAAYFVGLSMKEGRSARTFLALVLATMPVSFAVLGGLVYSQFHLEAVATLPSYATWVAPSRSSALLAVAGTLVVLVPLGVVSFVALARKEAKLLTLAFFAANLLVIVPVRAPLVVVVLAGVALLALLRLELTQFASSAQLDTVEGKLARVMPFAAPLLMLGRVFHLYHVGAGFIGGVLLITASAFWLLLSRTLTVWKRDTGAWIAAGVAVTGWALCWSELAQQLHSGALLVLLLGLPASALMALASRRAVTAQNPLLGFATMTALGTALVACAVNLDSFAALGCIVIGVTVAVWGAAVRALVRTISGSLVALFGLIVQVWLATHADNVLRWVGLSVVGVLLIVGSAVVERNRGRVARFWAEAQSRRLQEETA
ncbi:MAG TPA: hypothetical protein VNG33_19005 [Polyangiaceae bacterium]|nr:hypothetical protein [Polyangiaceae bacterium]